MFSFDRINKEFSLIQSNPYTPASKLAATFGVTERTIRSDISSMNGTLEHHGARVSLERGAGYTLEILDSAAFDAFLHDEKIVDDGASLSSSTGRLRTVIATLLDTDGYLSSSQIAEIAFVSESTAQSYIRDAKAVFERHGIECISNRIKGVRIFGSERDKRACYMSEVIVPDEPAFRESFKREGASVPGAPSISAIEHMLASTLAEHEVTASDYGFSCLLMHILLMIKRVRHGNVVEANLAIQVPDEAREVTDDTIGKLQAMLSMTFPAAEKSWLYPLLLTHSNIAARPIDLVQLKSLTAELISSIHRNFGLDLGGDQILAKGLFDHLRSVYESRDQEGVIRYAPLLKTIKTSFPLAFEIALSVSNEILREPPYLLNEGEVCYIALHIGAAIERRKVAPMRKARVLIVCSAGNAALQMLSTRVEQLFSDKIEVADCTSRQELILNGSEILEDIDLVLTTTNLNKLDIPTIMVDFRLLEDDVKLIAHWLEEPSTNIAMQIGGMFDEDLFFYEENRISRDDLLSKMCAAVVETGTADEDLHDLVLQRESILSTAIGKAVAIPHPIQLCSTETRVAVAILRKGIDWSENAEEEESIQIVFLLSMRPKMTGEIELLYDLIVKIANSEELQRMVVRSRNVKELIRSLEKVPH